MDIIKCKTNNKTKLHPKKKPPTKQSEHKNKEDQKYNIISILNFAMLIYNTIIYLFAWVIKKLYGRVEIWPIDIQYS